MHRAKYKGFTEFRDSNRHDTKIQRWSAIEGNIEKGRHNYQ
ncbi:MAG: hypothetical protein QXZ47_03125 [Candidatus Bathyarchaeia archaeon]